MLIVWYLIGFSGLHNLHPWYWNSLLYSLISSGKNSVLVNNPSRRGLLSRFKPHPILFFMNKICLSQFSAFFADNAIHNSPFFIPPGTHYCWVDRNGMIWEACQTPLRMAGSLTQAPVTHPSTNQARHCLTSVIWRELVTTQPCAIHSLTLVMK